MPLILSGTKPDGRIDVLICLDETSMERMKERDPFELLWDDLPTDCAMRRPHCIGVVFASAEDIETVTKMSVSGDPEWKTKAMDFLCRGFKNRPELGDNDLGPVELGVPTSGVKQ